VATWGLFARNALPERLRAESGRGPEAWDQLKMPEAANGHYLGTWALAVGGWIGMNPAGVCCGRSRVYAKL